MDNWLDTGHGRRPAIVVYSEHSDIAFLRLLRRGFRHCFVMVSVGSLWVMVDPLSHRTLLAVTDLRGLCDHLIALHHAGRRCQAVLTTPNPERKIVMRPFTCVEVVKRVLGISSAFVLTPYQLYKHNNKNKLTTNKINGKGNVG